MNTRVEMIGPGMVGDDFRDINGYVMNGDLNHEQIVDSLLSRSGRKEWWFVIERRLGNHFGIGEYFSPADPDDEDDEDETATVILKVHDRPPGVRGVKNQVRLV